MKIQVFALILQLKCLIAPVMVILKGKLTGILRERAVELIVPVIYKGRSLEEKRKFIIEGLNICAMVCLFFLYFRIQ